MQSIIKTNNFVYNFPTGGGGIKASLNLVFSYLKSVLTKIITKIKYLNLTAWNRGVRFLYFLFSLKVIILWNLFDFSIIRML